MRIAECVSLQSLAMLGAVLAAGPAAGWDRPVRCPADLGATSIDVSDYPAEYQRVYRESFMTKCNVCHTTARALAAPLLEVGPDDVTAELRAAAADPDVLTVGSDAWKKYIHRMWKRPPCCDLCPVFTKAEITAIWKFLVYDSLRRKTGSALPRWVAYRRGLIDEYRSRERKGELP